MNSIARHLVLTVVLLLAVAYAGSAFAQQGVSAQTSFNRQLVDKVEKGCIYIWAMSHEPYGFLLPMWIGSGVIIEPVPDENAAYAITNHHVGKDTTLLQVETWDRSTYRARLVATEPGIDCALIRIEEIPREAYEPCVMGNSDNVKPGEMALAIGAPGSAEASNTERDDPSATFGLHQSTTIRVVAGRQTNAYQLVEWWSGWTGGQGYQVLTNTPWRFVTQTAISGGNSGGPLFNSKGEIIGLNHAHFGAGPVITQNENYAIPINFCRNFAYQIIEKGVYELPWFGLDMLVPKNIRSRTDISQFIERHADPEVLRVYSVRKDSPAEAAGILPQDIIIEFDGRTFKDVTEFRQYVFTLDIGDVIPVVIERGREEIELNLVVGVKRHYNSEFSL